MDSGEFSDEYMGDEDCVFDRTMDFITFSPSSEDSPNSQNTRSSETLDQPSFSFVSTSQQPSTSAMATRMQDDPVPAITTEIRRKLERIPDRKRRTIALKRQLALEKLNTKTPKPPTPFPRRCARILFVRKFLMYPRLILFLLTYFFASSIVIPSIIRSFPLQNSFSEPVHQKSISSSSHPPPTSSSSYTCYPPIEQLLNLTSQCDRKNSEYYRKIQVLEKQLNDVVQHCNRKLMEKDIKFQMLVQGILNFRSERVFIMKSTMYFAMGALLFVFSYLLGCFLFP